MADNRWRSMVWLAAGILIGQMLGPTVAWAAEKMELDWPSVFKIEAARKLPVEIEASGTLPIRVERPIKVDLERLDRYDIPELTIKVEELPAIKIESMPRHGLATSFATLRETDTATWFVKGSPDGTGEILKLDLRTGNVERVSEFRL